VMALALFVANALAPSPPVVVPNVTTGSFRCEVQNRKGERFSISGSNRNAVKGNAEETSVFDIDAPARLRLAGVYFATLKGDFFNMKNWLTTSSQYVAGAERLTNLVLIGNPRHKDGSAFIFMSGETPSGQNDSYVGFCDFAFNETPQQVMK
jgi:hypothetical protein